MHNAVKMIIFRLKSLSFWFGTVFLVLRAAPAALMAVV
jgi:hypothetical protein